MINVHRVEWLSGPGTTSHAFRALDSGDVRTAACGRHFGSDELAPQEPHIRQCRNCSRRLERENAFVTPTARTWPDQTAAGVLYRMERYSPARELERALLNERRICIHNLIELLRDAAREHRPRSDSDYIDQAADAVAQAALLRVAARASRLDVRRLEALHELDAQQEPTHLRLVPAPESAAEQAARTSGARQLGGRLGHASATNRRIR